MTERAIPVSSQSVNREYLDNLRTLCPKAGSLAEYLSRMNGCVAFESALVIRPVDDGSLVSGLLDWNRLSVWRDVYRLPEFTLLFASDAFGMQFGLNSEGEVIWLNVESGEFETIAPSFEAWLALMEDDWKYLTGWPVAHAWQEENGPLPLSKRLVPKLPFVLGGAYVIENLNAVDEMQAMAWYSDLARQIRNLPDGSKVVLKKIEDLG